MQIHNVSKDKEVVVRLSPDELIKLCNVLYKAPDDEKNKLYYHLYNELMLAKKLCQERKQENMTIGKKIKLARSLMGLTTKEFGELVGLSDDRVRQYESDVRTPRKDKLKNFCDVLGVSESFFVNHHMETEEDIIHSLFELEKTCSIEVVQIDEENNIYGISFKDDIINEVLKEWCEKQELMKSGELSENDYALWQANFSTKE